MQQILLPSFPRSLPPPEACGGRLRGNGGPGTRSFNLLPLLHSILRQVRSSELGRSSFFPEVLQPGERRRREFSTTRGQVHEYFIV